MWCDVMWCDVDVMWLCHVNVRCDVMSRCDVPCDPCVKWCDVMWCDVMRDVMWCGVMWCRCDVHVNHDVMYMWCDVHAWCYVMWKCNVMWCECDCDVMWCGVALDVVMQCECDCDVMWHTLVASPVEPAIDMYEFGVPNRFARFLCKYGSFWVVMCRMCVNSCKTKFIKILFSLHRMGMGSYKT